MGGTLWRRGDFRRRGRRADAERWQRQEDGEGGEEKGEEGGEEGGEGLEEGLAQGLPTSEAQRAQGEARRTQEGAEVPTRPSCSKLQVEAAAEDLDQDQAAAGRVA